MMQNVNDTVPMPDQPDSPPLYRFCFDAPICSYHTIGTREEIEEEIRNWRPKLCSVDTLQYTEARLREIFRRLTVKNSIIWHIDNGTLMVERFTDSTAYTLEFLEPRETGADESTARLQSNFAEMEIVLTKIFVSQGMKRKKAAKKAKILITKADFQTAHEVARNGVCYLMLQGMRLGNIRETQKPTVKVGSGELR